VGFGQMGFSSFWRCHSTSFCNHVETFIKCIIYRYFRCDYTRKKTPKTIAENFATPLPVFVLVSRFLLIFQSLLLFRDCVTGSVCCFVYILLMEFWHNKWIMNSWFTLQIVSVQNTWSMLKQRLMQDLGRNCVIKCVHLCHCCIAVIEWTRTRLRSGFSIANQIKFDLRLTDLRLTWCLELIVDQLCFVFPCIFDLQLRDQRLVDRSSTEPTLCQSDWLRVTSICGVVLMGMRCEWRL